MRTRVSCATLCLNLFMLTNCLEIRIPRDRVRRYAGTNACVCLCVVVVWNGKLARERSRAPCVCVCTCAACIGSDQMTITTRASTKVFIPFGMSLGVCVPCVSFVHALYYIMLKTPKLARRSPPADIKQLIKEQSNSQNHNTIYDSIKYIHAAIKFVHTINRLFFDHGHQQK